MIDVFHCSIIIDIFHCSIIIDVFHCSIIIDVFHCSIIIDVIYCSIIIIDVINCSNKVQRRCMQLAPRMPCNTYPCYRRNEVIALKLPCESKNRSPGAVMSLHSLSMAHRPHGRSIPLCLRYYRKLANEVLILLGHCNKKLFFLLLENSREIDGRD